MKLREWNARLHGLVIFRALLEDPVVAKLLDLTDRMEAGTRSMGPVCDAVAAFEAALFEQTTNLGEYLANAVLETETVCVRQAAAGGIAPVMQKALDSELSFLQELCRLTLDELFQTAYSEQAQRPELAFLPRWETKDIDLAAAYAQRMQEAGKKGYGMFAKHHVFTVENGRLVPVKYPDPQRLSELPGYEGEREKVIANTKALLAGMPANNVLLYGDAGTGKSSAVKAIANEFAPDGLRLVEVKKNQLYQIPDLMDKLAANPLKFIFFIDAMRHYKIYICSWIGTSQNKTKFFNIPVNNVTAYLFQNFGPDRKRSYISVLHQHLCTFSLFSIVECTIRIYTVSTIL